MATVKPAIINSLPKAGTNLVAKCLELMGMANRGHVGSGPLVGGSPLGLARRLARIPIGAGHIVGIDTPVEVRRRWLERRLDGVENEEFITAHVGYGDDLLRAVREIGLTRIVVIRDPRAIIASSVPFILKRTRHALHGRLSRIDDRVQRYEAVLHGIPGLQSMKARCAAIEPWLEDEECLVVRFEDVVGPEGGGELKDQIETIRSIAHHLGLTDSDLSAIRDALFGPGTSTFRKGRIDSWREELPATVGAEATTALRPFLDRWGYTQAR